MEKGFICPFVKNFLRFQPRAATVVGAGENDLGKWLAIVSESFFENQFHCNRDAKQTRDQESPLLDQLKRGADLPRVDLRWQKRADVGVRLQSDPAIAGLFHPLPGCTIRR